MSKVQYVITVRENKCSLYVCKTLLLQSTCSLINDLFVDLQDGTKLLALLEILTGKQYVSLFKKNPNRVTIRNCCFSNIFNTHFKCAATVITNICLHLLC